MVSQLSQKCLFVLSYEGVRSQKGDGGSAKFILVRPRPSASSRVLFPPVCAHTLCRQVPSFTCVVPRRALPLSSVSLLLFSASQQP